MYFVSCQARLEAENGELVAVNAMLENKKASLIADNEGMAKEKWHDKLQLESEKTKLTDNIHWVETENSQLKSKEDQYKITIHTLGKRDKAATRTATEVQR